ncbi:MAG: RnfABCDGE type electron transport complex subunit B [Defluviitaleaceae bacterium]|nr:RnfABCDGE type electron transport complex subunit B [Defluviitaleaceae bacterium]
MISFANILTAVFAVGGIGLLLGIGLSFADRKIIPATDYTDSITDRLPGINCGACGYAGCTGLAQAISGGTASISDCPLLKDEEPNSQTTAFIACNGHLSVSPPKFEYQGEKSCHAAALIGGGHKQCIYGCLGNGSCTLACPEDAIKTTDGIARINSSLCTSCGKCLKSCPRNLIKLIHTKSTAVRCSGNDDAKKTRTICKSGCVACKLCIKVCKNGAINIKNNLAEIDEKYCESCGHCEVACPFNTITTLPIV